MELADFIETHVRKCYWEDDINCASTTLKILSEAFGVELSPQLLDAAVGMHGAGGYGAQCGLVEGMLLFLGVFGRACRVPDEEIIETCQAFARQFEGEFSSLLCRELRPEGFHPDNPPHLCEPLTRRAVRFDIHFIHGMLRDHAASNERPR